MANEDHAQGRGWGLVFVIMVGGAAAAYWAAELVAGPRPTWANETILVTEHSAREPPAVQDGAMDPAELFPVDDAGQLIVDDRLPNRIEEVLSTLPVGATAGDVEQLAAQVHAALPNQAGEEAAQLLASYDRYRHVLEATITSMAPRGIDDLANQLDVVMTLRRQHFGAEVADRMFGKEEAYSRYAIDVMRIEANLALSAEEKAAEIDALRQALPPELSAAMTPRNVD